jgi:hypothetical protein
MDTLYYSLKLKLEKNKKPVWGERPFETVYF